MRNIIFVGGIHGVGKTTYCQQLAARYDIAYYSASGLIANKKSKQFNANKQVSNIKNNQLLLKEAIDEVTASGTPILLDGHFCLLSLDKQITRIPEETFFELSPKALIVLTDIAEQIYKRLSERDKCKHEVNLLEAFQNEEVNYSKEISDKLQVPLYIVHEGQSSMKFDHLFV